MNSQTQKRVVGSGSAGQRHGKNLCELGCGISYFDPRADRLKEATADDTAAGRLTSAAPWKTGSAALKIVDACRLSSAEDRTVALGDR